ATEQGDRIAALRQAALEAMQEFERFRPYLTGAVLKGTAGPYAEIELQLFPESPKDVEIHLLGKGIAYETREGRRFAGDRAHAMSVLTLDWHGTPLRLSVFDPRDERLQLKKTLAGQAMERAGPAEVRALLRDADAT